jgi:hypothetical protein
LYGYEKEGSLSRFSSEPESAGGSDFKTCSLVSSLLLRAAENVKLVAVEDLVWVDHRPSLFSVAIESPLADFSPLTGRSARTAAFSGGFG